MKSSYQWPKVIDRMVLAIGSSWGDFCAVVLYPNGKSLFMTRFSDGTFKETFYIKTSKGTIHPPSKFVGYY